MAAAKRRVRKRTERAVASCGVIGHPVSHSLSPDIFGYLSQRLKRPLEYRRLDVLPEEVLAFAGMAQAGHLFRGWNVTIPHKTTLARFCADLSPAALAMGAVNVIEFGPEGARGHNTDVIGIRETLREQRFSARKKDALVFGAGGAAIAVGFVLGELGARRVVFQARRVDQAIDVSQKLARFFPDTEFAAADEATGEFDLYANATPLGMTGFAENKLLPSRVRRRALAFDLIYRPEKTSFLSAARKRGLRVVGGLDMLIWQAIGTWEIWFGPVRGKAAVKAALARHLRGVLKKGAK